MPTLEQQNQIPASDQSFLISPADLAAKKAKWLQEGYTEAEAGEMAKMLGRLSEMQDMYKDAHKPDEYWLAHPDEKTEFLRQAEEFEKEKAEIGVKREELRLKLKERKKPKPRVRKGNKTESKAEKKMENLEGRDPKKFLTEVFGWIEGRFSGNSQPRKFVWMLDDVNGTVAMCDLGYNPMPPMYVDKVYKKIHNGKRDLPFDAANVTRRFDGLESLLSYLGDKKVISLIESREESIPGTGLTIDDNWWYIKIIEPKTFPHVWGSVKVETNGVTEVEGFSLKVGDSLKVKSDLSGWASHMQKAIGEAKKIKVVGFGNYIGRPNGVVIQLDDDSAFTTDFSGAERDFEKIN